MTTAIVAVLSCTSTTTLHTQEVHIPVRRPVSAGGEMKAGLGHKWGTHCLQHDINNMFSTSWSTQCLNMHHFIYSHDNHWFLNVSQTGVSEWAWSLIM